jgi:DnaJ-class molecular chaperone
MDRNKEVIITETKRTCQFCSGTGETERDTEVSCPKIYKKVQCKRCKGLGYYLDKHYIISCNGIAFDCDTLK